MTGEKLKEIRIESYRTRDGAEELFFVKTLRNAGVVDITCRTFSGAQIEDVTIVYEDIVWRHDARSVESGDSWRAPNVSGKR